MGVTAALACGLAALAAAPFGAIIGILGWLAYGSAYVDAISGASLPQRFIVDNSFWWALAATVLASLGSSVVSARRAVRGWRGIRNRRGAGGLVATVEDICGLIVYGGALVILWTHRFAFPLEGEDRPIVTILVVLGAAIVLLGSVGLLARYVFGALGRVTAGVLYVFGKRVGLGGSEMTAILHSHSRVLMPLIVGNVLLSVIPQTAVLVLGASSDVNVVSMMATFCPAFVICLGASWAYLFVARPGVNRTYIVQQTQGARLGSNLAHTLGMFTAALIVTLSVSGGIIALAELLGWAVATRVFAFSFGGDLVWGLYGILGVINFAGLLAVIAAMRLTAADAWRRRSAFCRELLTGEIGESVS